MTTTSTKHNKNLKSQESVSFLFFTETEYKLLTYNEVWYLPKWHVVLGINIYNEQGHTAYSSDAKMHSS